MRAEAQLAGLGVLRQVMARQLKGELGLRLEIWHSVMQSEMQTAQLKKLQAELEAKAADASKGAGLRQLKQVMVRLAKGETAMRLEIWRMSVMTAAYAKHGEMQSALESQMQALQARGQGAGCATSTRLLQQIIARRLKGEIFMRLEVWRHEMAATDVAQLQFTIGELNTKLYMRDQKQTQLENEVSRQANLVEAVKEELAVAVLDLTGAEALLGISDVKQPITS